MVLHWANGHGGVAACCMMRCVGGLEKCVGGEDACVGGEDACVGEWL